MLIFTRSDVPLACTRPRDRPRALSITRALVADGRTSSNHDDTAWECWQNTEHSGMISARLLSPSPTELPFEVTERFPELCSAPAVSQVWRSILNFPPQILYANLVILRQIAGLHTDVSPITFITGSSSLFLSPAHGCTVKDSLGLTAR